MEESTTTDLRRPAPPPGPVAATVEAAVAWVTRTVASGT